MSVLPGDLGAIALTVLAYGAACLLFGLTFGYILGATRRERRHTGVHRAPTHRTRNGGTAAGRF